MARTRGQASEGSAAQAFSTHESSKPPKTTKLPAPAKGQAGNKRARTDEEPEKEKKTKKSRKGDTSRETANTKPEPENNTAPNGKVEVQTVISTYGTLPLLDLGLSDPTSPKPETMLAFVFYAMLTSARISHELAYKSVKCLVEAGYHNVETLLKSSWQERMLVLTEGGYTRYRQKTATGLGELAEFVRDKYDGDLNNLLKKADSSSEVRSLLKEIKGFGNVGVDIFHGTAQHVWPSLAPFIDPRSLKTAMQIGLGDDVDKLWEEVGKNATQMCKLSSALTKTRLEKREKEFH